MEPSDLHHHHHRPHRHQQIYHNGNYLGPSSESNLPSKILSVFLAALFVLAVLYLVVSSLLGCIRRWCRHGAAAASQAKPDPPCVDHLPAVPVVAYQRSTEEPEMCSVCLAEFEDGDEVRVLPRCKHVFHKACIDQWLVVRSSFCPICRDRVIEQEAEPARYRCAVNNSGGVRPPVPMHVVLNVGPAVHYSSVS